MNVSSWLQRFFAFEARNGGALPSPQLFPFYAESATASTVDFDANTANTTTTTIISTSGSGGSRSSAKSASPELDVVVSETHRNIDTTQQDESASDSRASTPPPPPPEEPPPTSAITTLRRKVVKVKDVGCCTTSPHVSHDENRSAGGFPLIYSRYVFLHVVTALQLLWGYFSFALWNYFAHIRWYGATFVRLRMGDAQSTVAGVVVPAAHVNDDDLSSLLDRFSTQWLAPAYLAFGLAGLIYTVSAVLYVCVVNTPCHVRAAWPHPQLLMKACCPPAAASRSFAGQRRRPFQVDEVDEDPFSTYGPIPRKTKRSARLSPTDRAVDARRRSSSGVYTLTSPITSSMPPASQPTGTSSAFPLSFTQPQFLFPLRRLTVLDREAAAASRQQSTSSPLSPSSYPSNPNQLTQQQQQQQQDLPAGVPYVNAPSSSWYPSAFPTDRPPFPPCPHYVRPSPREPSQQQHHRGDPKAALLWCAAPLVVLLVILDFLVVRGCRVRGLPIRFLQGLTPALGLALLLYTLKSVVMLCVRCCCECCTVMPIVVYQPAQQASFQNDPQIQQQQQSQSYYPVEM